MRFGFISFFLVLGGAGLAACGSGGGSLTSSDYDVNEGTYDPVPSIDALPASINPSTYTPVPGSYDTPPGQDEAAGGGTGATIDSVCAELGSDVLGINCPVTVDADPGAGRNDQDAGPPPPVTVVSPAECASACVTAGKKLPCASQFASAFACILDRVELSCDLLKDFSDQDQLKQQLGVVCQTSLLEYAACLDGTSAQNEPPPGDTCVPNGCARCADECARCKCRNNGDATSCTDMCP
jgi:hypothetical protein